MFNYPGRREVEIALEPSWKKIGKVVGLVLIVSSLLFFLVWAAMSPFVSSLVAPEVAIGSIVIFLIVSGLIVMFIYSQYSVGECPNCGRKLFFPRTRNSVRCFRCGRFLRIDFQGRKIYVPHVCEKG